MRPSGVFTEFEEKETNDRVSFKGVLRMKYERIPKAQLAFSILGNQEYHSHEITKDGLNVYGIIIRKGEHMPLTDEEEPRLAKYVNKYECQEIRELYSYGWERKDLAREFKLTLTTIDNIIDRAGRFKNI